MKLAVDSTGSLSEPQKFSEILSDQLLIDFSQASAEYLRGDRALQIRTTFRLPRSFAARLAPGDECRRFEG